MSRLSRTGIYMFMFLLRKVLTTVRKLRYKHETLELLCKPKEAVRHPARSSGEPAALPRLLFDPTIHPRRPHLEICSPLQSRLGPA